MLVVATSTAGTLRKEDVGLYEKYAAERNHRIKTYNPGELMFKIAEEQSIGITPENILDAPQNELNLLRRVALEQLKPHLEEHNKRGDVAMIRTHAMFPWKNVPHSTWRSKAIAALNPDMFITFVDEAPLILERLKESKQWHNRASYTHLMMIYLLSTRLKLWAVLRLNRLSGLLRM